MKGLLASLALSAALSAGTGAGRGEIVFVETDVDLRGDGSAVVMYTVQWKVLSGV